jgi:hypothetical protein
MLAKFSKQCIAGNQTLLRDLNGNYVTSLVICRNIKVTIEFPLLN